MYFLVNFLVLYLVCYLVLIVLMICCDAMLYSPIVRRFCGGKPSFQCFSFHPLLHSFGLSFKVGSTED